MIWDFCGECWIVLLLSQLVNRLKKGVKKQENSWAKFCGLQFNFISQGKLQTSEQWIQFLLTPITLFDLLPIQFSPPLSLSTSLPSFPLIRFSILFLPVASSILQDYGPLIPMFVAISGRLKFSRLPLLLDMSQRLGKFSGMFVFSLLVVSQFCSRIFGTRLR